MGAAQRHDLLVVEAHAVEDVAQVVSLLAGIRQPTIWATGLAADVVAAAGLPWDFRAYMGLGFNVRVQTLNP